MKLEKEGCILTPLCDEEIKRIAELEAKVKYNMSKMKDNTLKSEKVIELGREENLTQSELKRFKDAYTG